jgi:hypothetical protein
LEKGGFFDIYIKTIIVMTKFIITEEEKNNILGLYEQPTQPMYTPKSSSTNPTHPMDAPMWRKMIDDVEGDGVVLKEYIKNQKLVIDVQFDRTIYTITARKY